MSRFIPGIPSDRRERVVESGRQGGGCEEGRGRRVGDEKSSTGWDPLTLPPVLQPLLTGSRVYHS